MKKNIFCIFYIFCIFCIFNILLIPNVSAYVFNNTFDSNDIVNVNVYCELLNNSKCDIDSTTCSITAFYPNTSFLVQQEYMSGNVSGFFNYSFGILNVVGDYSYLIYCNNSEEGAISSTFTVGAISDNWEIAIISILIGTIIYFLYLANSLDKEHAGLKLFLTSLSLIFILPSIWIGYVIVEPYSTSIANIIKSIYYCYLALITFYMVYIIVFFTIWLIKALVNIGKSTEGKDEG